MCSFQQIAYLAQKKIHNFFTYFHKMVFAGLKAAQFLHQEQAPCT